MFCISVYIGPSPRQRKKEKRKDRGEYKCPRGWSGGAMMLGKLPVPGRPTNLDLSRAGPDALAEGASGGCLDIFSLIYHFYLLSPSLWETARYRLKYCLSGPLNPNQPTNQPTNVQTKPHPHLLQAQIGPCPTIIQIVGSTGTGSLPRTIAPPDHPLDPHGK